MKDAVDILNEEIQRLRALLADLLADCDNWGCAPDGRYAEALAEIDRLQRRELVWAASGRWCHDWITRATNLLGGLRDDLEHELAESGHLAELEQLLADDFEDGDDV